MKRSRYWLHVIGVLLGVGFAAVIGESMHAGEAYFAVLQLGSIIYFYVIGYERVKDFGGHGAWAILSPIILAIIVFGCIPSKKKPALL